MLRDVAAGRPASAGRARGRRGWREHGDRRGADGAADRGGGGDGPLPPRPRGDARRRARDRAGAAGGGAAETLVAPVEVRRANGRPGRDLPARAPGRHRPRRTAPPGARSPAPSSRSATTPSCPRWDSTRRCPRSGAWRRGPGPGSPSRRAPSARLSKACSRAAMRSSGRRRSSPRWPTAGPRRRRSTATWAGVGISRSSLRRPRSWRTCPRCRWMSEDRFRPPMPVSDLATRFGSFAEVELGYTQQAAIEEASRCLRCDLREV